MNLESKYPILNKLLRPFRRSQQKTCLAVVSAILEAAQANSFAIASELAQQSEIQLGSAVNRFYRFLRNERFDDWLLTEQLFSFFSNRKTIVLCLDWTSWGEKFSLLVASAAIEKRSLPVAVSAVKKKPSGNDDCHSFFGRSTFVIWFGWNWRLVDEWFEHK